MAKQIGSMAQKKTRQSKKLKGRSAASSVSIAGTTKTITINGIAIDTGASQPALAALMLNNATAHDSDY